MKKSVKLAILSSMLITARVRRYSLTAFASERNVYLWLKEARLLFAAVRGLRIAEADANKYKVCSSSVL